MINSNPKNELAFLFLEGMIRRKQPNRRFRTKQIRNNGE